MSGEVEEGRQIAELARTVPRVGQLGAGIAQFVKEWVNHGIDGRLSLCRRVLEEPGDKIDGVGVGLAEHLVERVRLDLGELVLHVVRIHSADLLTRRCTEHLDDLNQLVNARFAGEQGLSEHELGHDAAGGPNICNQLVRDLFDEWGGNQPILVV